jgi:hypothetical protein
VEYVVPPGAQSRREAAPEVRGVTCRAPRQGEADVNEALELHDSTLAKAEVVGRDILLA